MIGHRPGAQSYLRLAVFQPCKVLAGIDMDETVWALDPELGDRLHDQTREGLEGRQIDVAFNPGRGTTRPARKVVDQFLGLLRDAQESTGGGQLCRCRAGGPLCHRDRWSSH
jgi:hypothetical protein